MERPIPAILWVAVISLGIMILVKVIAAVSNPAILIDAVLSGILLYGIFKGYRWAFILTFVAVVLGTAYAMNQSVKSGMTVLVINCLVLVPVMMSKSYFFPEDREALKNVGDLKRAGDSSPADFVCGQLGHIRLIEDHLAPVWFQLAAYEVEKGGFSRAVGPNDRDQFTLVHSKLGPVDRLEIIK